MNTNAYNFICGYCGRPIVGPMARENNAVYHPECTHGPDYYKLINQPQPAEERIREIVREEFEKLSKLVKK